MAYWDTRAFRALKNKWYRKLAEAGFKDIETNGLSINKKKVDNLSSRVHEHESVQEFYSQVSRYAQYGKFDSTDEALIWALFVDGHSFRYIGNLVHLSHMSIKRIIDKHKKRMKETVYE